ncbi:MAG TPA: ABC transporter substrate-binding protein [Humisphaera sp.]
MNRRILFPLLAVVVLAAVGVGAFFLLRGDGRTKLQLNWKPEPQFGGFYAAALDGGPFKSRGLDVNVVPGGSGVPTVQMLGGGSVQFAVVSADELVIARSQGNDIVALLAVYQDNPQGLMAHQARGFKDIGDVFKSEGTVAMQEGLPYAKYLKRKYGFDKVKVTPSLNGDLGLFRANPELTAQCFVTSEPLAAKKAGVAVTTFPVKDSGFNPYTTVLACRGDLIRTNPKLALDVARACKEGWEAYLKDPSAANKAMAALRPEIADTFGEMAEAQKPLIVPDGAKVGVGEMTAERWADLVKQMAEIGVIEKQPAAAECFVSLKDLEAKAGK